jgi:uncharacterized protein (DUF58 family)
MLGFPRGDRAADPELVSRRPLYAIAVLLLLLSLILRQPLLFIIGVLLLVLAALPEIWYRFGLRSMRLGYGLSATRAVFGDTVELAIVVENRKALPIPWMELDVEFPDVLPVLGVRLEPAANAERAVLRHPMALWAFERVRRRYRLRTVARGVYRFGPTSAHLSDAFGILTRDAGHEGGVTLVVYPLLAPIERFGLSARAPFGERATPQRLLDDPLRVAGTREYVPGDEPRRISWKATARTGRLQSKVYEPSAKHTIALFLDVRTLKHASMGYLPEPAELAVSVTGSIAQWAIERGYAVGLVANSTLAHVVGDDAWVAPGGGVPGSGARASGTEQARLRIPPSSRPEQLPLILEGLARLHLYWGTPISQLLLSERHTLPAGATVVYVGAEALVDVQTIVALRQLRAHGHAVSLVLTTPDAKAAAQGDEYLLHLSGLPVHRIGGERVWEGLVASVLGPGPLRQASTFISPDVPREERQAILNDVHLPTMPADHQETRNEDGSAGEQSGTPTRGETGQSAAGAFILD